ncbi:MAG: N-formylglutamate amidohydrolase [Cyclobacteriaceae bacterium]|nr:N-formylglutamate amidohydrolase [Cyclobacteriaceae bacterium]
MKPVLLISCEHAGNEVPDAYASLFSDAQDVLASHRGWDPGALDVAQFLADRLQVKLFSMSVTRLLVEMNRSIDNPQLFSGFSNGLEEEEKRKLIDQYYFPYRKSIEEAILKTNDAVIHLSIHSFTPVLNGTVRNVDVGLLFDPDRKSELQFCSVLKSELEKELPNQRIEFNEPYKGTDDGLTTSLRKKFPDHKYLGIEIEINQKFVGTTLFSSLKQSLLNGIKQTVNSL